MEVGLLLLELLFMFLASLLSPGYCVDMEGEEDVEKTSLLNQSDVPGIRRGTMCESCGIKRPLRSCHCAAYVYLWKFTCSCDKCVVRFDHHDILINNCVGYGNQHFFFLFLLLGIIDSFIFLLKGVLIPLFSYGLTQQTCIILLGIVMVWNRR